MKERKQERKNKEDNIKKKNKSNKELYLIAGWMIGLIVIFLAFYFIFQSFNKFDYEGLTFKKIKYGDLPLFHYSYFFDNNGEKYQYNLFLRNDPRENKIPITGDIVFSRFEDTFISINGTGLLNCPNLMRDIGAFSSFLVDNGIKARSGTPDEKAAEESNLTLVNCLTHPLNNVILLQSGSNTKIEKEGNCHIISINNCEVGKTLEKFEIKAIIDAKKR